MSDTYLNQEAVRTIEEFKKENFQRIHEQNAEGKWVLQPYSTVDLVMFVIKKYLKL